MKLLKSKLLWTIVTVFALVMIFLMLMPKPIDMNLEKIGNGKVSVVFIYDPNLAVSNQQATEINKAHEIIGDNVNFLVARQGDPTSEQFRTRYAASSADLLFFNANGELTDRRGAVMSAEEFIARMSD